MSCELAVAMPVSGSFQEYATKFINPATGFTIGWLYWLSWANTTGLEFTTAGITMQRWFPDIPVWVWCLIFGVTISRLTHYLLVVMQKQNFGFQV